MKKSLVLIVVVVLGAVAWAGATYVVGGDVEKRYSILLEESGPWGPVSLSSRSYQRGFLGSKAETVLEVAIPQDDPETAPESLRLVFEHVFRHGPLPFGGGPALARIETRLAEVAVNGESAGEFLEKFPELKQSALTTSVAFSGTTTSRLSIPAFERRTDEGDIKWGGLTLDSEYAPGAKTVIANLALPGMDFRSAEGNVILGGIRGRFDLNEVLPQLYVGTNELTFDGLTFNQPRTEDGEGGILRIKDLAISLDSAYENPLVSYRELIELAELTVNGETFGPGVFDVEMKNLDGEVLSEFQKQVQDIYQGMESFNPDEQMVQLVPLYLQLFTQLMEGKPELNIRRLHLDTPMGAIDGNARVRFAGGAEPALGDPTALLQGLEADVAVAVHEKLVRAILAQDLNKDLAEAREQGVLPADGDAEVAGLVDQRLASQIDALLAQKWVVREGEQLKANASFKSGELLLNGQSLPILGEQ